MQKIHFDGRTKKNIRIQTGNINTDEVGKKHTYQMIDELFSRLLQKSKNVDAEDQTVFKCYCK